MRHGPDAPLPAPEGKRRIGLLHLPDPPPSPHFWVPGYARHLGGCLLARAPDLVVDESGACMKPASA
ncbi:hypothetical protein [Rhodovulum imhoffii]|uniref:hypothetical protein n=1 Tax=Rhodovulum imhoffii TaxID=365340 RepID=UPI000D388176|nr:hypothetical protein [Rhodovulum imhoffii]MBK5932877.1 hypothetical protein [Rhodovulum imhoffii]